jgi:hypothetical protein
VIFLISSEHFHVQGEGDTSGGARERRNGARGRQALLRDVRAEHAGGDGYALRASRTAIQLLSTFQAAVLWPPDARGRVAALRGQPTMVSFGSTLL